MALILQSLIHLVHFNGNTQSTSTQAHMKVFKTSRSGPERHKKAKSWSCFFLLGVEGWGGMGWDGDVLIPKGGWGHFQEMPEFNIIF